MDVIRTEIAEFWTRVPVTLIEVMHDFVKETAPLLDTEQATDALRRLDVEYPNIAAALDEFANARLLPSYEAAYELYTLLGKYTDMRVPAADNRRWGDALVLVGTALAERVEINSELWQRYQTAEANNDLDAQPDIYNDIGVALWQQGRFEAALFCLRKALQRAEEVGKPPLVRIGILLNISNVHYMQGFLEEDLMYVRQALVIARDANDEHLLAEVLSHLAMQLHATGGEGAEAAFEEAIRLYQATDDALLTADTMFNYALYLDARGQQQRAYAWGAQALALMQIHDMADRITVAGWLAELQSRLEASDLLE